jgi:AcrR family transcriptional regulator
MADPGRPHLASSRDHLLDVAERHFAARGYAAVTIKDIAGELGIRQPSIYYHVPGGKEDLYVEVMLRHFERHRAGALAALNGEDRPIEERLRRLAAWMLSRPPLDMGRLVNSDYPELAPGALARLEPEFQRCIFGPIEQAFRDAESRGRLRVPDAPRLARVFLSLIDPLNSARKYWERLHSEAEVIEGVLDIFSYGVLLHAEGR